MLGEIHTADRREQGQHKEQDLIKWVLRRESKAHKNAEGLSGVSTGETIVDIKFGFLYKRELTANKIFKDKAGSVHIVVELMFHCDGKKGSREKRRRGVEAQADVINKDPQQNESCNSTVAKVSDVVEKKIQVIISDITVEVIMDGDLVVIQQKADGDPEGNSKEKKY